MKRKARIIRYWQVVDKNNITIDNAHTHKEALEIKKEYEKTENNQNEFKRIRSRTL